MLRFYGEFVTRLGILPQLWQRLNANVEPDDQSMQTFFSALKYLEPECERLEMSSSLAACRNLRLYITQGRGNFPEIGRQAVELYSRASDELEARHILMVPLSKVGRFEKPIERWQAQVAAFPSTQVDIEEAERCYALGRPTACVFHLMRALESPLKTLSAKLEIVKHSPTWEAYLSVMAKQITAKFPDKSKAHNDQRSYYSALEGQLRAIKTAWRNPTMHELARVYTDDMAEEMLTLIRGFMREAAIQLSEEP